MSQQSNNIQPMGSGGGNSRPASRPQLQPMQPVVQPRGWLRTLATLSMPGLVIVFFLGLMQLFAPPQWKPAYLLAAAMSQYEVTVIRETLVDRAEAERMVAEARAEGEREAEIEFQAQLKELEFTYQAKFATVQAQLQSGMEAYKSLYDRANLIQQAVYQMEGTVLQHKQQAVRDSQAGKALVANAADIGCAFVPELCKIGDNIRDDMADELVDAGRRGAGQVSQDYLRGLPDPAQLQSQLMLPEPAPVQ